VHAHHATARDSSLNLWPGTIDPQPLEVRGDADVVVVPPGRLLDLRTEQPCSNSKKRTYPWPACATVASRLGKRRRDDGDCPSQRRQSRLKWAWSA